MIWANFDDFGDFDIDFKIFVKFLILAKIDNLKSLTLAQIQILDP